MPLITGEFLGPYQVLAPLGAGGMGEVYRARDTKLNRDVALKMLPDAFATDPDRLARFTREAQALAALNHPQIAQIYGLERLERHESPAGREGREGKFATFIVMELVDGEDLAQRLARGPLALDEALPIARQIAEGLEAAHEQGIVHRDLKPANIKVRADGTVKVLDFGLAKAIEGSAAPSREGALVGLSMSPTVLSPAAMTKAGVILGTAAYMAPEQARGKAVDRRADIWAFGVVVAEMVAGAQVFEGETVPDLVASVIAKEPRLDGVPADLRSIIEKCLRKDPRKRWQSMGDVRLLLEEGPAATTTSGPNARSRFGLLGWLVAAALGGFAAVAVWAPWRQRPTPQPVRFEVNAPANTQFDGHLAVSPDGRKIAFTAVDESGKARIWIRALDATKAQVLNATVGAGGVIWSSDSRWLAFTVGDKLKKIDSAGGPPETLCDWPRPDLGIFTGAWGPNGVILFAGSDQGIFRVSASGGQPAPVTSVDQTRNEPFHRRPSFLPDGRHFVYFRPSGVYVGDIDAKPEQQSTKRVLASQQAADFIPSSDGTGGHLLFLREGVLMAQPFDTAKMEPAGEPIRIAEAVGNQGTYGFFSLSRNGVLAFRGDGVGGLGSEYVFVDRKGQRLERVIEPGGNFELALSPDGTRIAMSRQPVAGSAGNLDIWQIDLARRTLSRFTFGQTGERAPVWSPDGRVIAFASSRGALGGDYRLFQKLSNGVGNDELLYDSSELRFPRDFSRDGKVLLFEQHGKDTGIDLWTLDLNGRKATPWLATPADEGLGTFSPDGHWIAYASNESGRAEIYVRSFLDPLHGGKWMVSNGGADMARWRSDGKELLYSTPEGQLMAVDIATAPEFSAGTPRLLFTAPMARTVPSWAVTPDGQRFLLATAPAGDSTPMTVVLNWQTVLKRD